MILAIHFARLGPYHLARLESAVEVLGPIGWKVVALETAGADATYDWERTGSGTGGFQRRTVFPEGVFERIPAGELRVGIFRALDEIKPDAVAVAGWGTVDARACLVWCKKNRTTAIVMSETRAADGRRVWWREWVKSRIVRKFDGSLCGGESHRRYLEELGMPREKIELGYNVVDNQFFWRGRSAKREEGLTTKDTECAEVEAGACLDKPSDAVFSNPFTSEIACDSESTSLTRSASGPASKLATSHSQPATPPEALPRPYFLASNRFVERKNLGRLLEGYAGYVARKRGVGSVESGGIWPLVLLGDGELRKKLEDRCEELGLRTARRFSHGGTEDTEGEHLKLNSYKLKTPPDGGLVVFVGFRQIGELPEFYAGAGAFIHPALEEPWGLVINEAMASGLPVLSSRNVGAAEELVVEGETGFLFDPMDIEEMTRAMVRISSMPEEKRKSMGLAAQEMLEKKVPKRAFGEGLAKLLGK